MDDVAHCFAGADYSMAIDNDGVLWAWGLNDYGQLGDGTTENRLSPVKIMEDVEWVELTERYALAIKTDGSLWA